MDVTLILDRADYLEQASPWVVSIAKELVYGLPVESGRTRIAVVTYGDNATVNFNLNTYSKTTDMINAMTFGYMGSRSHLQVCSILTTISSHCCSLSLPCLHYVTPACSVL